MTNKLREKLSGSEPVFGTHVSLNDPCICELIGGVGFDFIWIDTEHSAIDYKTLQTHLMGAKAAGTAAVVRVPWNDAVLAKRVLEMGPEGIVFPMVNTLNEANRAMNACLYPPLGNRGFGPCRAIRYGLDDVEEYINQTSLELCRFIQIESETAVRNLPEIVKNKYIDGYIVGPCDLSGSIGELGDIFGERVSRLIDEAVAIIKAAGKPVGVSTGSNDPQVLKYWHDKGMNIISAGSDYAYILAGARKTINALRDVCK